MNAKALLLLVLAGATSAYLYWLNTAKQSTAPTPQSTTSISNNLPSTKDTTSTLTAQANLDKEIANLLKQYTPQSPPERAKIINKLTEEKHNLTMKPKLLTLLEHEHDEKIKAQILRTTASHYRGDPQVITAITQCMAANQADPVREAATDAIRDLGENGHNAVEAIVKLLSQDEHRLSALTVLAEIGPAAKDAVTPIAQHLTSKRAQERKAALKTLSRIGIASATALGNQEKGIIACLKDQDPEVRAEAAHCLKRIGKDAQRTDIKSQLEPLLKDTDENVRREAQQAWEKLFTG